MAVSNNSKTTNQCSGCGGLSDGNSLYQRAIIGDKLNSFQKAMQSVIKTTEVIEDIDLIIKNSINEVMTEYVNKPLFAMMKVQSLLKIPAEQYLNIATKVNGYSAYIDTLINDNPITYSQKALNQGMLLMSGTALNLSVTSGYFIDRNQSLYVENKLLENEEKIIAKLESIEGTIGYNETESDKAGEEFLSDVSSKNELLKMFEMTRAYLRENLSELPLKLTHTLKTNRNYIDLCYELYNDVSEETLSKFIADNNIKGNEIIMLEKGRVLYYYI